MYNVEDLLFALLACEGTTSIVSNIGHIVTTYYS